MSGTSDFDWTPKEQIKKEKKKLYIRFILSLVLSNTLVAALFYNPAESDLEGLISYSDRKDYSKLILPLENYAHFSDESTDKKINLFDQQGTPLITDGHLLSLVKSDGDQSVYLVEIPINQIEKLHALTDNQKPLKAYPHDPSIESSLGGKVYEIQF